MLAGGEFRGRRSLPDQGASDDRYNPGWLPLSTDGKGDHHCLDLAPTQEGKAGQILILWHDEQARTVVAGSLSEWLDDLASAFERES
jgi:cell wall assembly regulator SMI1